MDKENKENVTIYLSIYLSIYLKKEGNPAICDNMDGPWGHCAKWNKRQRKANTVWSHLYVKSKKNWTQDFPGGPVVTNPPSNAGDVGSIPGQGTKIPRAMGWLSLRALEPVHHN